MEEIINVGLIVVGSVIIGYLVYKIVTVICIISNALEDEYRDFSNSERDARGE
jgi:hypothetical protein